MEEFPVRWDHSDYEEETEDKKKTALRAKPQAKPAESYETEPLGQQQVTTRRRPDAHVLALRLQTSKALSRHSWRNLMSEKRLAKPKNGTVEHRLWQFSVLCNKESPHPLDWRRFYLFVVYAHQRRAGWDENDVRARLRLLGFNEKYAVVFANAYWPIRCALHMTKARPMNESYHAWLRYEGTAST